MFIELVMPSSHLILCRPLLLPPIPPSTRVLSNESTFHMSWPKYWSFSFSISPSNEHPGMMDWLDLLAVQGTLKSLLQHHSSKAPILQCSTFFIVQLLHPYMTTGKTIGYLGSISGSGRSPGEGNNTHSSILAWRIPWTDKPDRVQSMGSQRIGHD